MMPPLRHELVHQFPEPVGMVALKQVHHLVDDDVLEALNRFFCEFEPDGDYFAYVTLREWGRLLNVTYFSFTNTMTLEEKVRSTASFIGRFVEVDRDVADRIRDLVQSHADADGSFTETNNVVVMWWEVDGRRASR
jgi:hypothetical protein